MTPPTETLEDRSQVEVDRVDRSQWSDVLAHFRVANLFQTWEYGSSRWGERQLSHLVLRRNGRPIAAAQVRVLRLPVRGGLAYVTSGPMWQRRGEEADLANLRLVIKTLREGFVTRRHMLLTMLPRGFEDRQDIRAARGSSPSVVWTVSAAPMSRLGRGQR